MKLRIAENFRAVFYAPYYALIALDLGAPEGLQMELLAGETPGSAIDGVKQGTIDLTWGGPMRVMKDHDATLNDGASLLCFGEVVARDPFYLVGKPDPACFDLRDLAQLRLGVVSEVPTPWCCLQADLRDRSIDLAGSGRVVTGLTMAQQLQALGDGQLDVIQVFEPYVSQALAEHTGQILYAACERGPTSYTAFICSRDGLQRHAAAFTALLAALQRLKEWIAVNGPAELARYTARFFPGIEPARFAGAVARYHAAGIWTCDPSVSRTGFERLGYSMHSGGFLSSRIPYETCVYLPS